MDLRRWVIGYDFAFGRGRTGSAQWFGNTATRSRSCLRSIDGHDLHSSEVAG